MDRCCEPAEYARIFDEKNARSDARSYRRKGLDREGRRMLEALVARGVDGASVLEVGGGVGALHTELLRAGAARATNVEIVGSYEDDAGSLAREQGLEERIDRRVFDFAMEPDRVDPADLVVVHRVICCYPDMPRLVSAAASRTRRRLALSFPPDRWWWRLWVRAETAWLRVRGCPLGGYFHDPREILDVCRSAGLRTVFEHRGHAWQVVVLERPLA